MNPEEEIEQHTDHLKVHDADISDLRKKVKLLTEYCQMFERCGFMPTNHAVSNEARSRMKAIISELVN